MKTIYFDKDIPRVLATKGIVMAGKKDAMALALANPKERLLPSQEKPLFIHFQFRPIYAKNALLYPFFKAC